MSFELKKTWQSAGGFLPSDWSIVPLESLLRDSKSIAVGVMYPGLDTPNGTPLIKVGDVRNGTVPFKPTYCISAETNEEHKRTQLIGNELLITLVGNPGECVVVKPYMAGWNPARAIAVIRLKEPNLRIYLKTVLEGVVSKHLIDSVLNTTVQKTLNLKDIRKLPIPMPPKATIDEISAIVESLDNRISLLRETNTTLEAIAQTLFKSWFVNFDPVKAKAEGRLPEGMDEATAALFPSAFEGSALGLIPKGWRVGSLADLMDISGGTQPPASQFLDEPSDGYIRLIQIRDYETDAHITFVPDTDKLRKTTQADIMIARYGASVGRICWGLEGAYNVALVRVVCGDHMREYLRTYLKSDIFQNRLDAVSGRSAQAGFNKGDIASFRIVIPSIDILQKYQELVWAMRSSILTRMEQAKTLIALRDTLLPRLISGQLRLNQAQEIMDEVEA